LSIGLIVNAIVDDLDTTLTALADPTRRRVVELLRRDPQRAGDIASQVGTTPAAMSRHLRVLRRAGIVEVDTPGDDARVRVYRLRPDRIVQLQAWLDQVQAFWTEQLGSFVEHAERTRGDTATGEPDG
jgi:DNA-binding transcriptional ArsR family regulator